MKAILYKLGLWKPTSTASALYAACLGEARNAPYYDRLGVADTLDGRFDLLSLLVALVVLRLQRAGSAGQALGQDLIDTMFADMEQGLRVSGVSDEGMKYRIRDMVQAFMGRMRAYGDADSGDEAHWAEALSRNIYRDAPPEGAVNALVMRIMTIRRALDGAEDGLVLGGGFCFPPDTPPS